MRCETRRFAVILVSEHNVHDGSLARLGSGLATFNYELTNAIQNHVVQSHDRFPTRSLPSLDITLGVSIDAEQITAAKHTRL